MLERFIRKHLPVLLPYRVVVDHPDGDRFEHRAFTFCGALHWMRSYPIDWGKVTIFSRRRVLAVRYQPQGIAPHVFLDIQARELPRQQAVAAGIEFHQLMCKLKQGEQQ